MLDAKTRRVRCAYCAIKIVYRTEAVNMGLIASCGVELSDGGGLAASENRKAPSTSDRKACSETSSDALYVQTANQILDRHRTHTLSPRRADEENDGHASGKPSPLCGASHEAVWTHSIQ